MGKPKLHFHIIAVMILVTMLLGGLVLHRFEIKNQSVEPVLRTMMTSSYTPHAPIFINDDDDFIDQGWSGNGTEEEPYVIEDLSISGEPECIYISNTRAYVEIRDCVVVSHDHWGSAAIILQNVTHATVKNCHLDCYGDGLYLTNVNSSVVTDNFVSQAGSAFDFEYINHCEILNNHAEGLNRTIWNVGYGYYVQYATHCIFTNNTASDRWYTSGIVFGWSENCEIKDNFVLDSDSYGLILYDGDFCVVDNNTIAQCEIGIWVSISESSILLRNKMTGNDKGLYIESSTNLTLTSNVGIDNSDGWHIENTRNCTLNDNEFDYGLLLEGSSLSHWLHDMSGNSVGAKPLGYFVNESGMVIDASGYGQIILANCSEMMVANGSCAVELGFSRDCTVENISVHGATYAFYLMYSDRCNMTGNIATDSGFTAFHLDFSDNCTLTNNIVSNSEAYGFYFHGLSGCTISENLVDGAEWSYSLLYSSKCNLTNNIAFRGLFGYNMGNSDNCTLINNTAVGFSANGVRLLSNQHTLVYLNRIGYSDVNALDTGSQNRWDNGTHGNYWSDYSGEGTYTISGSAGSIDAYPFTLTTDPPEIDNPADVEYYEGTTGNQIVWHPHAEFPKSYAFYRHGVPIESGVWNGSAVIISADWFVVGTHNFTIRVTDFEGRSVSDTVFVTVIESTTTTTTSTTTTTTTTLPTTSITTTITNTLPTTTGPSTSPQENDATMISVYFITGAVVLLFVIIQVRRRPR